MTRLPGTCYTQLPTGAVLATMRTTALPGRNAFVLGLGDRSVGRVQYINCRYGVTGNLAAPTPELEITVSLYRTTAQAAARVRATITAYRQNGATSASVTVGTRPGTLLTGGNDPEHAIPVLVTLDGQRTVAVSIDPSVATGPELARKAEAVAALAMSRTSR